MKGATKTRTQRRMEKRQAVILLALVLAVSLASFTLGVIVGRRGAERDMAHKLQEAEKVLVAQTPALVAPAIPVPGTEKTVGTQPSEPAPEKLKLSFYDNLSKKTAPLGSGINLAPVEEQEDVKVIVQPPIDLPDQPIVKKEPENVAAAVIEKLVRNESVTVKSEKSELLMPKVVPNGSYAVQIGSFNAVGDAIALKRKMLDKNYPVFVVEADLGAKGLWYRVRIGPYADSASAKSAQKLLDEKEQLKSFVSRQ